MSPEAEAIMGRVRNILAGVSYKKGWSFGIGGIRKGPSGTPERFILYVRHKEPNTDGSGVPVDLFSQKLLTTLDIDALSDAAIVEAAFNLTLNAEVHEVEEWFRFEGKHFRDPHPDAPNFTALP